MNETYPFTLQSIEDMRIILSLLQQQYGELKLYSSRTMKIISRSIDEIVNTIFNFLRDRLGMYNIDIFFEHEDSDHETKHIFSPIFATYYNCLLLNTNFFSQYLFKKDKTCGHVVGIWPTLSPYLFIQIIWRSKCEDLLIESLMHIPLDLCLEILEITIKHIDELAISRARRLIFLLIYKIYNKCLWLHLGTISKPNVMTYVQQLIAYFELLLDLLVSPKLIISNDVSIEQKYLQHGILVKNILYCIQKCMCSKIKRYSKNYKLAIFFKLTYSDLDEYSNYHHMLRPNEVKSIIITLDHKLATLLLKQVEHVNSSERIVWENINDSENNIISLHRAIIIECHYLREFMKQNNFLVKNEQMLRCLKHLIGPRKSEEYILTVQELRHNIAKGKLHDMQELIIRYKEWDLRTLDFIGQRTNLLKLVDFYTILKYLYYKFRRLHTKTEKYHVYISVLKILNQLTELKMHIIILKYMELHSDDSYLEYLYNEKSFDTFIRRNLLVEEFNDSQSTIITLAQKCRILLIFILLNPKEVLSKLIFYEISIESSDSILFQRNMLARIIQSYYKLRKNECNMLTYILKNIVLQRRTTWHTNFRTFMNRVLDYQLMTADDVINKLYIPYLSRSYFEEISIRTILLHVYSIVQKKLCTKRANFRLLTTILIKKASLIRRFNAAFSKFAIYKLGMKLINNIVEDLCFLNISRRQYNMIYFDVCEAELLDIKKVRPTMNTLNIIRQYENCCSPVYQLLRTDPRCHPKLRNYVQSFDLNREAFIRHIMLHCFEKEYIGFAFDLTFIYWYNFGWTDHMMAYENIIRITADVWQIALMYSDKFPKHTFIMLLYAIVKFSKHVTKYTTGDKHKICHILLETLSSMNSIVSETCYGKMYDLWLKRIQNIDPDLEMDMYFNEFRKWLDNIVDYNFEIMPIVHKKCICDENLYCKYHDFLIKKKIRAKYNAYMFVRECMKSRSTTKIQYLERLLRNLCSEE